MGSSFKAHRQLIFMNILYCKASYLVICNGTMYTDLTKVPMLSNTEILFPLAFTDLYKGFRGLM